jgi:hypothetical protein
MGAFHAPHALGAYLRQIDDLRRPGRSRAARGFGAQPAPALLQCTTGGPLAARLSSTETRYPLGQLSVAGDGQFDPFTLDTIETVLDVGDQQFIRHVHVTPRGSNRFCSAFAGANSRPRAGIPFKAEMIRAGGVSGKSWMRGGAGFLCVPAQPSGPIAGLAHWNCGGIGAMIGP